MAITPCVTHYVHYEPDGALCGGKNGTMTKLALRITCERCRRMIKEEWSANDKGFIKKG